MVVVVLVVSAWLGWIVRSACIQREAVGAIQEAHGIAIYEGQRVNGRWIGDGERWPPRWLVNKIDVDYFHSVNFVMISHISEDELVHIERLRRLRFLLIT
jgi:hypothetical protein